jgi:hypothetical protein
LARARSKQGGGAAAAVRMDPVRAEREELLQRLRLLSRHAGPGPAAPSLLSPSPRSPRAPRSPRRAASPLPRGVVVRSPPPRLVAVRPVSPPLVLASPPAPWPAPALASPTSFSSASPPRPAPLLVLSPAPAPAGGPTLYATVAARPASAGAGAGAGAGGRRHKLASILFSDDESGGAEARPGARAARAPHLRGILYGDGEDSRARLTTVPPHAHPEAVD